MFDPNMEQQNSTWNRNDDDTKIGHQIETCQKQIDQLVKGTPRKVILWTGDIFDKNWVFNGLKIPENDRYIGGWNLFGGLQTGVIFLAPWGTSETETVRRYLDSSGTRTRPSGVSTTPAGS